MYDRFVNKKVKIVLKDGSKGEVCYNCIITEYSPETNSVLIEYEYYGKKEAILNTNHIIKCEETNHDKQW